jgi:hypothetical protein
MQHSKEVLSLLLNYTLILLRACKQFAIHHIKLQKNNLHHYYHSGSSQYVKKLSSEGQKVHISHKFIHFSTRALF